MKLRNRLVESGDRRAPEAHGRQEGVQSLGGPIHQADRRGLNGRIGRVVLSHVHRRGDIVPILLGEGPYVRHHRVLHVLLLARITAHDKRRRRADDRTAAHVNPVRGQGDVAPRRRGKGDRWDVRVDSETGILYVLDRTNDLLHVRQESAGGIHDDDEILVGRDRGLGRPMDIVGRPGIDLDVEGDEEYARGTRQRTRRRRRRGSRQERQHGYRHGQEGPDQRTEHPTHEIH